MLTYLVLPTVAFPVRVAVGHLIGTAALGLLGFTLAQWFGLQPWTVWLPALLLSSPCLLLLSPEIRRQIVADFRRWVRPRWRSGAHWAYLLVFMLTTILLYFLYKGAFYEQDGSLYTSNHHNHGDLPWHIALTQGFVTNGNFPPEHMEFAGVPLTYPFLADFVTAQYVCVGAPLISAFLLHNLMRAFCLLIVLHWWAISITRNRFAFLTVPAMLLFSGGWGWLTFIPEAQASGQSLLAFFARPPHDVTIGIEGIRWGNLLTTLLITQRGFLMGFPLALIVFTLFWKGFRRNDSERLLLMAAAGCVAGLILLGHGHTFLVVLLTGATLAIFDIPHAPQRWRGWVLFFGIAGALAFPQALILANKSVVRVDAFFGVQAGWDSNTTDPQSWAIFWYRNTGPLFLLLGLALFWRRSEWQGRVSPRLKLFFVPFGLCFVVGNVFRVAPWIWDNYKVLYYFQVGAVLLIGVLLSIFWRRGFFGKITALLLFFLMILSGAIDVWRLASFQTTGAVFDPEGRAFAALVGQATPPGSRILQAPQYSHPILLTGRRLVCGYNGHLWSHGLDYDSRQQEVKRIYAGDTKAEELLQKLKVNYITVGPPEYNDKDFTVNEVFLSRFRTVVAYGSYRLLAVPQKEE